MLAKFIEEKVECVLLEKNEVRARHCSAELNKTLILRADSLTESALEESGLHDRTAFVALTGDDESNIMNCLMAQKKGTAFTVTQITRTDFIPVVEQLYLVNRVVSPYLSTANAILHYLRSKNVRAASLLHNLPGELLDIIIAESSRADGKRIHEIKMPSTAIIATVLRNDQVVTATGDLLLKANDRVLVFCCPDAIKKIQTIFL
jgi:trk system potassium uptake protein TrkA